MTRSHAKWWSSLLGCVVLAAPLVGQAQSVSVTVSAPPPPRVEVRVPPPPQVVVSPPPPRRVVVAAPAPVAPAPPPRVVVAAPPPPPAPVVVAPPPPPTVHVAPPVVRFEAPPPLVAVQPGVQVVADSDDEVFFAGGWYFTPGPDGVWFRTRTWRGGWEVAPPRVVPVAIGRIPRGHYRRWHGGDKWREREERREEKWRRKHGR